MALGCGQSGLSPLPAILPKEKFETAGTGDLRTCWITVLPSYYKETFMALEPSDVVFIAIVIWLAIILMGGDSGGGRRKRVPVQC